MSAPEFKELEEAARAVIGGLKGMPEFNTARLVAIGGLTVLKHLPNYRSTMDVDLMINVEGAPKEVKARLLGIPNGPFEKWAEVFIYRTDDKQKLIQIDICPGWMGPYIPDTAMRICDIPAGHVPYLTELDVMVFKIRSCGLRADETKRKRDAADAFHLLKDLAENGPITLTPTQVAAVREGLPAVLERTSVEEQWWRTTLNVP
ncbi:uncharacterized protein BDV14DRAFT_194833 [Aspergillus stella-maris]|uniref:uncharacterized protein n=1 Tax=Aspergillus stella-maris TaxID=1810926 RepID=UPI003CCDE98D